MSQQSDSSTERRKSLGAETDDAIGQAFLQALWAGERPDLEAFLEQADEPQRARLRERLLVGIQGYERRFSSASDDTDDWTDDEALSDGFAGARETLKHLGRYRIERLLGKGAFGQVYLAHDEQLDRLVAIKTPRAGRASGVHDIEKFRKEARVLAKLDHSAIVPVYDVGMTDDHRAYVVSKYIDGADLGVRIAVQRPSCTQAAEWIACIAEALHHAHTRRLVHRDVKPGNILLDHEEKPYLADFGLALQEEDFGRGSPYAGTVYYMSPEQARGEGHLVDGRSDIFSLGIVLYILLTGERPFRGRDRNEVMDRIVSQEVRPPRQYDDRIPKELERICLQTLAKRATDRYNTALDLADDLRHFLKEHKEAAELSASGEMLSDGDSLAMIYPIVPRGLRAFDKQDADFFMKLLPGPYDRHGLPRIVRFWKRQIENVSADETFRVGLIYGPSGCGKSSLVQAGILPSLTPNVRAVYLAATPSETESSLLNMIRSRFPDISGDADLTETLTEIRRGQSLADGEKLLIIIDQFEQWLHSHHDCTESDLCQALRQCDGQHVQCVLLLRDDFWMSVTRFMNAIEVRIIQGENSTAVDLFDRRHARRVLAAFGRAYDALPLRRQDMDAEQLRFLDQAVEDIAQEGKVIPVQLVLFAEMVKHQAWSPATLRRVGGMQGIGVTFLEETFASSSAVPEHRVHQSEARAVLRSLLPDHGVDIKGHTRSRSELFHASGCTKESDFDTVMQILDSELRLLTPVETQENKQDAKENSGAEKYYQLTHDYLVPALRQWLTQKQRETRRGRAELLLADRAELWSSKPERKQLPSFFEWLSICRHVRRRDATDVQRKMMRVANWHHVALTALYTVALLAVVTVGVLAYRNREDRSQQARSLVNNLLRADIAQVPGLVEQLSPFRDLSDPMLDRIAIEVRGDPHDELNVSLARFPTRQTELKYLLERRLSGSDEEADVIRQVVLFHASDSTEKEAIGLAKGELKTPRTLDAGEDAQIIQAQRLARAAAMLFLLGEGEPAWPLLAQGQDPQIRTHLIHEIPAAGITPDVVIDRLFAPEDEENISLEIGLLLSLAKYEEGELTAEHQERLLPVLLKRFEDHPHSGVHSACQCLLRALGAIEEMAAVNRRQEGLERGSHRDWYVTVHGHTMAVIRDPEPFLMGTKSGAPDWQKCEKQHEEHIDWSFAIGTTEVTLEQFRRFSPGFRKESARPNSERHPIDGLKFQPIMDYCNKLSHAEGISEDQWCYVPHDGESLGAAPNFLERTGYRLPSEREWEYACRAGTTTTRHDGYGNRFLGSFAWYAENTEELTQSVGLLLPNDFGLFDVYGNAGEFCQDRYNNESTADPDFGHDGIYIFRAYRGGSVISQSRKLRSAERSGPLQDSSLPAQGFRLCRTHKDGNLDEKETANEAGQSE